MTEEAFTALYTDRIPEEATTPQCLETEAELERLQEHFDFFVGTPMETIDDEGNTILDEVQHVIDLEADLRALYVAGNGVGAAMLALTPLPYVGPAFKVLRKLVSTSVKSPRQAVARRPHEVQQGDLQADEEPPSGAPHQERGGGDGARGGG